MGGADWAVAMAGRALAAVRGAPLGILMYHAVVEAPLAIPDWCFVSRARFAAQMAWLAEHRIAVLPLVEAVAALRAGWLTRPTVAITFDDGYRNNLTVALPVLARHRFPATIFLATDLVGGDRALWPSRLNRALAATSRTELAWRGTTVSLTGGPARAAAHRRLQEAVKAAAGDAPGAAVTEIEAALGVPVDPPVPPDAPHAMLGAAEIAEAAAGELVEFGAHTKSHPLLSRLDDARLLREIDGSLDAVAALTGRPCRSFAYPNGRRADFDDRAVRRLAERGVAAAVTTVPGENRRAADPLRLRRWGIGPDASPIRFAAATYGVPLEAAAARLRRG